MQELTSHALSLEAAQAFLAASRSPFFARYGWQRWLQPQFRLFGRSAHLQLSLHYAEPLQRARAELADPRRAFTCLDIPEPAGLPPTEEALWSMAVAMSISSLLMDPLRIHPGGSAFGYLQGLARRQERPSFQSSSLFQRGNSLLYLPEFVGGYTVPAAPSERENSPKSDDVLCWLPLALWEERAAFLERLQSASFLYRMEEGFWPDLYEAGYSYLFEAPFNPDRTGERVPFLNAQVVAGDRYHRRWLAELQGTLGASPHVYKIPLRPRRLVIYRNTRGFSAIKRQEPYSADKLPNWLVGFDKNGFTIPFKMRETRPLTRQARA